jgi:hypothetical protein
VGNFAEQHCGISPSVINTEIVMADGWIAAQWPCVK